jgi:hypothetical protein
MEVVRLFSVKLLLIKALITKTYWGEGAGRVFDQIYGAKGITNLEIMLPEWDNCTRGNEVSPTER